jgi:hypothetical protein
LAFAKPGSTSLAVATNQVRIVTATVSITAPASNEEDLSDLTEQIMQDLRSEGFEVSHHARPTRAGEKGIVSDIASFVIAAAASGLVGQVVDALISVSKRHLKRTPGLTFEITVGGTSIELRISDANRRQKRTPVAT